jgi:hypothetical protein
VYGRRPAENHRYLFHAGRDSSLTCFCFLPNSVRHYHTTNTVKIQFTVNLTRLNLKTECAPVCTSAPRLQGKQLRAAELMQCGLKIPFQHSSTPRMRFSAPSGEHAQAPSKISKTICQQQRVFLNCGKISPSRYADSFYACKPDQWLILKKDNSCAFSWILETGLAFGMPNTMICSIA